jgi:hypothetical protein
MLVAGSVGLSVFLAVEAVYLAWLIGLSPIWIPMGLAVAKWGSYKWRKRFERCVGWGVKFAGWLFD